MRSSYVHQAYGYSGNDFSCGRESSTITARPGPSTIKHPTADYPTADYPMADTRRQTTQHFFRNILPPQKSSGQFLADRLPNLADDPKKKFYSTGPRELKYILLRPNSAIAFGVHIWESNRVLVSIQ